MSQSLTEVAISIAQVAEPFEDVLVYADGTAAAMNALAYAEALSPHSNVAALMVGQLPIYPASEFATEVWALAHKDAEVRAEQDEARLRQRLERTGSRAEIRRINTFAGGEDRLFAQQALYVDASVIGWPSTADSERPVEIFEGALFQSGRPVILVPDNFKIHRRPNTIVVAWAPSHEAARAVNDAMPFLRQAAQVRIAIVADGGVTHEENPGDDIARHLARHDVKVDVRHIPINGQMNYKVLLGEVLTLGADMLVMGGYSHSRTSEWLFGGMTRDMLGKMTVPVLMSH